MKRVHEDLPALYTHMFMDGEWVWYCGPSLAGADNKNARETLKEIGFRFAFKGHPMRGADGQPTKVMGSWGHSCAKPMGFRRKGKAPNTDTTTNGETVVRQEISPAYMLGLI